MTRLILLVLAFLLPWQALADCGPVDGIESVCGLNGPEDIEPLPGGRYLVFSQMHAGLGLSLLDTEDDAVRRIWPPGAAEPRPGWGDPACAAPKAADVLLHGIHLKRRKDGGLQLLAVNHGGREAVEFFEIIEPLSDLPVAVWRGCVEAAEDLYFNDVVALDDGGFLVTHMFSRSAPAWGAIKALLGAETGRVYRWRPGDGMVAVPGTDVRMANGIAIDAEETYFYLNVYLGNELRKYPLEGGEPVAVVPLSRPDNSAWDSRGRLLVASHEDGLGGLRDGLPRDDGGPVDLRFRIVALDPDTLEREVLLEREGPPMGGGTVAVEAAGYLYIGSYTGDRLIKFPLTLNP